MFHFHVIQSHTRISVAAWSMNSVGNGALGPVQTYHQICSPSSIRSAQVLGSMLLSTGHHRSTEPNSGGTGSSVSIRRTPGAWRFSRSMPSATKS